jgi:hypothetical protein
MGQEIEDKLSKKLPAFWGGGSNITDENERTKRAERTGREEELVVEPTKLQRKRKRHHTWASPRYH